MEKKNWEEELKKVFKITGELHESQRRIVHHLQAQDEIIQGLETQLALAKDRLFDQWIFPHERD